MFDEPIKEVTTPNEMRAEFLRLYMHDSTVRHVFNMAEHQGLSGEDKYVTLAYVLAKQVQQLRGMVLDGAYTQIRHIVPEQP